MTRAHMLYHLDTGKHIGFDRPSKDTDYIWQIRIWREAVTPRYIELLGPEEEPSPAVRDKLAFPYRVRVSELHCRVVKEERYVEFDGDARLLDMAKFATVDEVDDYLDELGLTNTDLLLGYKLSMI